MKMKVWKMFAVVKRDITARQMRKEETRKVNFEWDTMKWAGNNGA